MSPDSRRGRAVEQTLILNTPRLNWWGWKTLRPDCATRPQRDLKPGGQTFSPSLWLSCRQLHPLCLLSHQQQMLDFFKKNIANLPFQVIANVPSGAVSLGMGWWFPWSCTGCFHVWCLHFRCSKHSKTKTGWYASFSTRRARLKLKWINQHLKRCVPATAEQQHRKRKWRLLTA